MDNALLHERLKTAISQRDYALSVVSHDLRNALSGISICVALLEDSSKRPDGEEKFLRETIRKSVNWMNRIIGDLLDVTSIESGHLSCKPGNIDPVVPIAHALNLFEHRADGKRIKVRVAAPDYLPAIWGDEARLVQVLLNLLANALRFTPGGGIIVLSAALKTGDPNDTVVFSVTDTGPGVMEEHLPHIFDPFWHIPENGSDNGLGLGLSISKGIVEAHGGTIWVENGSAGGATFYFSVPLARAQKT